MGNIAIRSENISKQYRIGGKREPYQTIREAITKAFLSPVQRAARLLRGQAAAASDLTETLWALKDVSCEIKCGEIVGIIGGNGAGKSTFLKILSRITEPTDGYAEIYGRVGSLLEVGTGFHAELTGRENIYLNGAILGMKRAEIQRKFDEIIAFAEVERFIDTPVKHYSSGMYMRLAFAVAAHLEPEILLVDEVLAVGDANFQKKCLTKMEDVGKEGRTVLFVSHNMSAITRLCERAILLHDGRVQADGPVQVIVNEYLTSGGSTMAVREWPEPVTASNGEVARLRAVRVRREDGQVTDTVDITQSVGIEMEYEVLKPDYVMMPNYHFTNEGGLHIFSAHDLDPTWRMRPRPPGRYISTAWIPGNLLSEGFVSVSFEITTLEPIITDLFFERHAVSFQVVDSLEANSARGDWTGRMYGVVRPALKWTTQFHATSANQATNGKP
jgi:lipopolysaccharide transport system ATP-binding protein